MKRIYRAALSSLPGTCNRCGEGYLRAGKCSHCGMNWSRPVRRIRRSHKLGGKYGRNSGKVQSRKA